CARNGTEAVPYSACEVFVNCGCGNRSVAGRGDYVAADALKYGRGGFFGEGAAGGELAADERYEREGGGVVPDELVAAGDGGGGFCIDVGKRANAALMHGDVAATEVGVGKNVCDAG